MDAEWIDAEVTCTIPQPRKVFKVKRKASSLAKKADPRQGGDSTTELATPTMAQSVSHTWREEGKLGLTFAPGDIGVTLTKVKDEEFEATLAAEGILPGMVVTKVAGQKVLGLTKDEVPMGQTTTPTLTLTLTLRP